MLVQKREKNYRENYKPISINTQEKKSLKIFLKMDSVISMTDKRIMTKWGLSQK